MRIIVIEKDYSKPEDICERYLGVPCHSFDEAFELVYAHVNQFDETDVHVSYVHNGTNYAETHAQTGELLKEFFVRAVM